MVAALLLGLLARYLRLTPFQTLLLGLGTPMVVMIVSALHEIAKWLRELTYEVCKLHDHLDGMDAECGGLANHSTFHFRNLERRLSGLYEHSGQRADRTPIHSADCDSPKSPVL